MPGRTPYEAYRAFVEPLAAALACVATAKIQPSAGGTHILYRDHNLYLTRQGDSDYVRLQGEPALDFRARMVYRLIEDPRAGFGPILDTTRAYDYSLRPATGEAVLPGVGTGGSARAGSPSAAAGAGWTVHRSVQPCVPWLPQRTRNLVIGKP
jgi:hypothetical protein